MIGLPSILMRSTSPIDAPIDDTVLSHLVDSHRRFLAFVAARVEDRQAAQEILQTAFLKAAAKRGDLRDEASSVAWFFRILRNTIVDHYRHRAALERLTEASAGVQALDLHREEVHRELCSCFEALLPTLSDNYATMLRAVDLAGRTVNEVADELGITPNNAHVRLHRARTALRKRLEQTCGTCAEHGCLDCSCGGSHS
jgi:RNA polymerase sigma-70 factor (ECF subfamily)